MSKLLLNNVHLLTVNDIADGKTVKNVTVTENVKIGDGLLRVVDDGEPEESDDFTIPSNALPVSTTFFKEYYAGRAKENFFGSGTGYMPYGEGKVFASVVPLAWNSGTDESPVWQNPLQKVDPLVKQRKILDNRGLNHEVSSNLYEKTDDYIGKEWVFYWEKCNYVRDDNGIKFVTAIKDYDVPKHQFTETPDYDNGEQVGVFGPAFWFFCKEDMSTKDDGTYYTSDGTKDGKPLYQIWGISDVPYQMLDDAHKTSLASYGIGETDFHIWPECLVVNDKTGLMQERPYWVHSAYPGARSDGKPTLLRPISVKNKIQLVGNNSSSGCSYNNINNAWNNKAGGASSGCVTGFSMLFDIVKNATKNSQDIHTGVAYMDKGTSSVVCSYSTKNAGYIIPVATATQFKAGCTVCLNQGNWNYQAACENMSSTAYSTKTAVWGRVKEISNQTFETTDGTTVTAQCLVINEDSVPSAFYTRTNTTDARAVSNAGNKCGCYVVRTIPLTGETDQIIGKHDGTLEDLNKIKHASEYASDAGFGKSSYRVQGTEYGSGLWSLEADMVVLKGDGSTSVDFKDTYYEYLGDVQKTSTTTTVTPSEKQYVFLCSGLLNKRKQDNKETSISTWITTGNYKPVGIFNSVTSGSYILNCKIDGTSGIVYPTAAGGTNSGSTSGHGDGSWYGANPAEILSFGSLHLGVQCGSAARLFADSLSYTYWNYGARD